MDRWTFSNIGSRLSASPRVREQARNAIIRVHVLKVYLQHLYGWNGKGIIIRSRTVAVCQFCQSTVEPRNNVCQGTDKLNLLKGDFYYSQYRE